MRDRDEAELHIDRVPVHVPRPSSTPYRCVVADASVAADDHDGPAADQLTQVLEHLD
jgi:hypothetical protein